MPYHQTISSLMHVFHQFKTRWIFWFRIWPNFFGSNFHNLFNDIGHLQKEPTIIMLIIKMLSHYLKILSFMLRINQNKHIDIQYHYIDEHIELNTIQFEYIFYGSKYFH
jgi:hypothetical protein